MVGTSLRKRCSELKARLLGSICGDMYRDESGNVLPMMAVAMVVLAGLVGSGVDMSRAYKAQRRLQAACDAGVLAGRRAVTTTGFDSTVQTQAKSYFNANFDDSQQQTKNTVFTPSSDDKGATVNGTATTELGTIIMSAFGFQNFDLAVDCSASMGVGNSDVMFVLDNTGSMADEPDGTDPEPGEDSKLESLQDAMKAFYDTVNASMAGTNSRVRYGFVPYSSAVNVGHLLYDLDPSYIRDSITVQSVQLVNWSASPTKSWTDPTYTYGSTSYGSWTVHASKTAYSKSSTCKSAQTASFPDTAFVDNGAMTYDTSTYDIDTTTGHQIKTTGNHQPQTMTDYECRQSGGSKDSNYYIDSRVGTRDKRGTKYEERTQVPVTTNNTSFTNAVLQQRTLDTSVFKTFASVTLPIGINNSGSPDKTKNVTSTWAGCIMERATTPAESFVFVDLETGITPEAATDLDIDAEPTGDMSSQWSPLWPEVTFDRDNDVPFENLDDSENGDISSSEQSENRPSTYCPHQAQQFEEMDEEDFDDYADSLVATGSTYHDIGMLWGARLSSPTGLWQDLVNEEAPNDGTVSRHLIFMTDGILQPSLGVNSTYGMEYLDKRITGDGDGDKQYDNHMSRFLALCQAVKARGIRLWVIAFGTSLTTELTTCATDGLASAFQAKNASELNKHFQEIANQVGELRVIQ